MAKFTFLICYFLEEKLIDISYRARRWFTEILKILGLTKNKKPKGSEKIPKNRIPKYFKFCISYKQQKITVANRQQSNLL